MAYTVERSAKKFTDDIRALLQGTKSSLALFNGNCCSPGIANPSSESR